MRPFWAAALTAVFSGASTRLAMLAPKLWMMPWKAGGALCATIEIAAASPCVSRGGTSPAAAVRSFPAQEIASASSLATASLAVAIAAFASDWAVATT